MLTKVKTLPSYLYFHILIWLIFYFSYQPIIFFIFLIPLFTFHTNPLNFFYILVTKRKPLKIRILGDIQLFQRLDPIILQYITQITHIKHHTQLFNLINFIPICKLHHIWTNRKILIIFYLYTLFGYIHPCTLG